MGQTMDLILNELQKEGIVVGEDVAIRIAQSVFTAIKNVARQTETKIDDLAIPILEILEPKIIEMLEQIDPND